MLELLLSAAAVGYLLCLVSIPVTGLTIGYKFTSFLLGEEK